MIIVLDISGEHLFHVCWAYIVEGLKVVEHTHR